MGFVQQLATRDPTLKRRLLVARISKTPEQYLAQSIASSLVAAVALTFGVGLFVVGMGKPLWVVPILFVVCFLAVFSLMRRAVDVQIRKAAREIDKDVIFAGRFLLIKLNSGRPLISAITDASNSYGVANKYFKEIVRDIELGTPLEQALDKASRYCPSDKMRRILFQISNALNIGVDVTNFLEAILDELSQDQLVEIQKYGRKLSGITMFYMLFAVIIPSLGITMFITMASLISLQLDFAAFIVVLFFLVLVEFMFLTVFRSIRPNVNI